MTKDMTADEAEAFLKRAGGVAFPSSDRAHTYLGMTLRDYFAGQALIGITTVPGHIYIGPFDTCAKAAYDLADAMLREREVVR